MDHAPVWWLSRLPHMKAKKETAFRLYPCYHCPFLGLLHHCLLFIACMPWMLTKLNLSLSLSLSLSFMQSSIPMQFFNFFFFGNVQSSITWEQTCSSNQCLMVKQQFRLVKFLAVLLACPKESKFSTKYQSKLDTKIPLSRKVNGKWIKQTKG